MKLLQSLSILAIALFFACIGISGEKPDRTIKSEKNELHFPNIDSSRFFYSGYHRVTRGQKAIKRT